MSGSATGAYDVESYNAQAFDSYNTKALEKCDGCGRTFLPESLLKHAKMCKGGSGPSKASTMKPGGGAAKAMGGGGGGAGSPGGLSKSMKAPALVKPRTLVCYICGREFGTASLEIHLKSCKKKWDNEQMMKPKHERKPCPEAPKEFSEALSGAPKGGYDLDSYNAQATDSYQTKGLEPCTNCGRTFLPESLLKHAKFCKGPNGSKPTPGRASSLSKTVGPGVGGGSGGAPSRPSGGASPEKHQPTVKPRGLMCYICGREFGTASLAIHLKTCTKKFENE